MYESPISILYSDIAKRINTTLTDNVVKVVQSYGIHVDKDELLKALDYDRKQYEKGYADAKEEFEKTWIPCSERLPEEYDEYLCQYDDGAMIVGWLENAEWCKKTVAKENIVAWMPLPELYKGGK